jgi:hypothetical protein
MRLPDTVNETSFAVCFADATSLVLDAISLTGRERRTKLSFAQARLERAFAYSATPEEVQLATGLNQTIRSYEQQGLAW